MACSVFLRCHFIPVLSVLLAMWTGFLSLCSPIRSPENRRGTLVGMRDVGDNPLLDAQDFLSQFLSTLNLTERRPQPSALAALTEPPEYMLELYERFANDRTAVPSANIVRSFKNEDSSPYTITTRGKQIYPLLFNISIPRHEHITIAELRLFALIQKAQRPYVGLDYKVTIYNILEGVVWTKQQREGRRRDKAEVVEMKDLEELVTKNFHAKDNGWVSFDLTHVFPLWQKSGCTTYRLEAHITNLGSAREGATEETLVEVDIDRSLDGNHNAVMIIFSNDHSKVHKQEKQELSLMIEHENDLLENRAHSQQQASKGHVNHNNQNDHNAQSLTQLQSNLIYDTPPRIRRNVKSEPCKRTPLFVDFKDIGWDKWIIQPLGYEAFKCNGVCSPPMTDEVSPTKHAIVQTLLSVKSPEKVSRACCVPTKLEPISLLYHDDGAITFNHKYEGMVVAECGCR